MSRLTIEIEPEQHRQIKTLAAFSGVTIKEFMLSKTIGPQRAALGDATDRLMRSKKIAARLREAIATPDPEHRVFESMEDLKDALVEILTTEGPYLLDIVVEKEGGVFPMVEPGAAVSEIRLKY